MSPAASIDTDNADKGREYLERQVALLNIPDTINAERIQVLCEPYGGIRQVILRPDHGGAIVEFNSKNSVGKVRLGLDGTEIEGRVVKVDEPGALWTNQKVHRVERLDMAKPAGKPEPQEDNGGTTENKAKKSGGFMPNPYINRPTRGGGRRGGLGSKRGRLT